MFFVGGTGAPGRALSDAPGSRSYGLGRCEMRRCGGMPFIPLPDLRGHCRILPLSVRSYPVALLLLSLGLSACAGSRPVPPLQQRVLVTVDRRGGRCVQGVCTSRTLIRSDGAVLRDGVQLTTVPRAQLARLVQLIAATDFVTVRAVRPTAPPPFAGCQSAVDGWDVAYQFATRAGVDEVDGCKTALDFHAPLFELIDTLLASPPAPPGG